MTAEEASKATKEAKKIKGLQKLDMIWICGIINNAIKKACRKGKNNVEVRINDFRGDWLIKEIGQIYIKMGYTVKASRDWVYDKIVIELTWK